MLIGHKMIFFKYNDSFKKRRGPTRPGNPGAKKNENVHVTIKATSNKQSPHSPGFVVLRLNAGLSVAHSLIG